MPTTRLVVLPTTSCRSGVRNKRVQQTGRHTKSSLALDVTRSRLLPRRRYAKRSNRFSAFTRNRGHFRPLLRRCSDTSHVAQSAVHLPGEPGPSPPASVWSRRAPFTFAVAGAHNHRSSTVARPVRRACHFHHRRQSQTAERRVRAQVTGGDGDCP